MIEDDALVFESNRIELNWKQKMYVEVLLASLYGMLLLMMDHDDDD